MVAAIGNGASFAKGRDFATWLGLVPKQMSTGDRTILGRISKRGNRYLRTLLQGKTALVTGAASGFGAEIARRYARKAPESPSLISTAKVQKRSRRSADRPLWLSLRM
jgi:transposase